MKKVLLGIDIGTCFCKCLFLTAGGRVLGESFREYRPENPGGGISEQHPGNWYRAFILAFRDLCSMTGFSPSQTEAVGVTGQMRGVTLLGHDGTPLIPSILWNDQRCAPQVEELLKKHESFVREITHNPINTMCSLPKILWLMKFFPEIWKKTSTIIYPKDYINYHLTGVAATDMSDASGSSFYNIHTRKWSDEICGAFGIDRTRLPPLLESTEITGTVTLQAAAETGLREGIPVVAGASDAVTELLSAGITGKSQCKVRLGTSGALSTLVKETADLKQGPFYCWSYIGKDNWMIDINTRACALSVNWLRDVFYGFNLHGVEVFRLISKEAAGVLPGSEGLFFHPYLQGEDAPYWNSRLKGSFFGIKSTHKRAHFARAVLEATAYALSDAMSCLVPFNKQFKEFRLTGGGVKSSQWRRIVADVMGIEGKIIPHTGSALGAAMLAGLGTRRFSDIHQAVKICLKNERDFTFNKENHNLYKILFEKYKEMKSVFDQLYEYG